jgi:Acetyl-CoA dehydrogenase C-terminal like
VMSGGAGLALLVQTIGASTARAAGTPWADLAADLDATAARLAEVTATLWSAGDPVVTLANASVYLEAAGHLVVGWLWLEQALAAEGSDGDLYAGKRQAARYFQRWELPKVGPQLDLLASLDTTTLEMRPTWF